jgi:hypothetical protein
MPRDLLAGLASQSRPPRDLFANGAPTAAPSAPDPMSSVMDAVFRSNPVAGGIKAGFDVLPQWLKDSLGRDAGRFGNAIADAIQLPNDTLTNKGGVNDLQIDPTTGQPQPFSDPMIERSANAAGFMTPGELHPSLLPGLGERVTTAGGKLVPGKVLRAVKRDQTPVDQVGDRVNDLGDAGMVADIGDNTQKLAAGVATQPGEAGAKVANAMRARSKDSMDRIPQALDDTLGAAKPPSELNAEIKANKETVGPEYDQVLENAGRVHLASLAADLDSQIATLKGPALTAVQSVRAMLNANGANASDLGAKLETSAAALFQVRQAIDTMLKGDPKGNEMRVLTDARQKVDAILTAAAPGIKDIDAKYHELGRQERAVESGGAVFDKGKEGIWPQENAKAVAEGVQPEGTLVGPSASTFRLTQAGRAELERIVGQQVNDRAALASLLGGGESNWNPQKLAQLFGPERADKIVRLLQNERQMAETENLAINNSKTAAVTAAQQDLNGSAVNPSAVKGRTLVDLAFGIADALTSGATAGRRALSANDIADAVIGRGDWKRTAGAGAMNVIQPLESALANGGGNSDALTEAIMRGRRP